MADKLINDGERFDGRALDEMRPIEADADVTPRADGSAYFALGTTQAIASVQGPRELHPRKLQENDRAYLKYRYAMAPFSTEDRIRPGPSRRSREINEVSRWAFNSVVDLEEFPKAGIGIHVDVLRADASTRCTAINAASIALADAGVPMTDLIASCAVGKVEDQWILDVAGKEDTEGQVDLPIAYIPRRDEIALLQMDGIMKPEDLEPALEMAIEGCKEIHEKQKEALKRKYRERAEEIPDVDGYSVEVDPDETAEEPEDDGEEEEQEEEVKEDAD